MPRLVHSIPKYRKHRASGQAVVTIAKVEHYLGPHGTKASHLEYDRLILEWVAAGRPTWSASGGPSGEITVADRVNAYRKRAVGYYRKEGKSTCTEELVRPILPLVKDMYGKKSFAPTSTVPLPLENSRSESLLPLPRGG